ncbi:MAG TPA: hypothetical protein VFM90_11565, partial [Cyclobacteriaceae bacterium]|nr:hypothetical protein [Cyclobacteriaceae bacterium]
MNCGYFAAIFIFWNFTSIKTFHGYGGTWKRQKLKRQVIIGSPTPTIFGKGPGATKYYELPPERLKGPV